MGNFCFDVTWVIGRRGNRGLGRSARHRRRVTCLVVCYDGTTLRLPSSVRVVWPKTARFSWAPRRTRSCTHSRSRSSSCHASGRTTHPISVDRYFDQPVGHHPPTTAQICSSGRSGAANRNDGCLGRCEKSIRLTPSVYDDYVPGELVTWSPTSRNLITDQSLRRPGRAVLRRIRRPPTPTQGQPPAGLRARPAPGNRRPPGQPAGPPLNPKRALMSVAAIWV